MTQITVGQLIEALKQLPEDSPVLHADTYKVFPTTSMDKLRFMVWPRLNGEQALLIGAGATHMKFELKGFGIELRPLAQGMKLPEPPEPTGPLKALEHTGWPFGVQVLQGREPVDREQFIREWESDDEYEGYGFGPIPEWATILDEEEEYAKMEDQT